jgi:hypothetical protein
MGQVSRPPEATIVIGVEEEGVSAADDLPACQSCRRRKLKCSRQTPSCSQCQRLGGSRPQISRWTVGTKANPYSEPSMRVHLRDQTEAWHQDRRY